MSEQVVDAEVVEEQPERERASTDLAPRERRSEVLKPLDADQVVSSFAAYQQMLPKLLSESDYQGKGKDRFVKKSGWRKIATAFDLDVQSVRESVERDLDGQPVRAEAVYRAIAPSGRFMDGDGYCSVEEPRFKRAGGRQKLENDLRATASTRAKNRAIADLVGMGAVSAEEIDSQPVGEPGLEHGASSSAAQMEQARQAISYILDGDDDAAASVLTRITQELSYPPRPVMVGIIRVAQAVKEKREAMEQPA